jgi:hypothetical protein
MDLIPIQPTGNNFIKPATSTANDGGSKSQSGYINTRIGNNDELKLSEESKRLIGEDPVVEEKSFLIIIKEFIISLVKKIIKILSFKSPEKKQEVKKSETGHFLDFTGHINE